MQLMQGNRFDDVCEVTVGTNQRSYGVEELLARDTAGLDLFWLRDESLSDSDNLPAPEVIAAEIIEDLQSVLDPLKEFEAGRPPAISS